MTTQAVVRRIAVLAVLTVLTSLGCGGGGGGQSARDASLTVDPALTSGLNEFGFRLHQRLAGQAPNKNVFISPPSLELALAMTANGARGSTQAGMLSALRLDALGLDGVNSANRQLLTLLDNPDPAVTLRVANALWTQNGIAFRSAFLGRVKTNYAATAAGADFHDPATADAINKWASDNTAGLINHVVTTQDIQDDVVELTNAVYFKGPWADPFDPKDTSDGAFTRGDGTTKTVPMMFREGDIDYQTNDLFQAVRLPYGNKYLLMVVLLPTRGKTVADIAAAATSQAWKQWNAAFQPAGIQLRLPRFKAEYGATLNDDLSAMGMAQAFDARLANLLGMFAPDALLPGNIYLTHVIHKTYLSVDEKGTTAAAVTDVGGGAASAPPAMVVNRPFVLAIQDGPTGAILFLGTIADPQ